MRVLQERVAFSGNPEAADAERAAAGEWRVLESGVLATATSTEVVTEQGRRRVWCDPRGGGRLVCEHGWGAYHLNGWNGPRAHLFSKPEWTTCDCRSATGLCGGRGAKRQRCHGPAESADCLEGEGSGGESDRTVVACGLARVKPPSYYETLVAQHGTTELRPGLKGARVPGVVGAGGAAFYLVQGDAPSVLRCRHGHTTNTLSAQARERRRWAAGLVLAALFGRRVAVRALLGGAASPAAVTTAHGTAKALVRLLVAWNATREARRARRGVVACGCASVYVSVKVGR